MGFEIPKAKNLEQSVFNISNEKEFEQIALNVFNYQYFNNSTYRDYCKAIRKDPNSVSQLEQIPFLPIQLFKTKEVKAGSFDPEIVFTSSGTSGNSTSRHYVKHLALYEKSFSTCFEKFFGRPEDYCVLGLLPSYLERSGSSLVYMVDWLIKKSGHASGGFFLSDLEKLKQTLSVLEATRQKTILFGVTYALLDFAQAHPMPLQHTAIIETGGMKGRRKEISKPELYDQLKTAFTVSEIHAEYGMTELLSQAYAINGIYTPPPWMRILLREETDPFSYTNRSGAINVIDLANIYSCSFIATDDLGRLHGKHKFEVLGRLDNSDIRGCSQLVL